ncbi:MAG: histidine phosphatase family protein [Halomonas sp.]|nr:histidine phosphatase family protein [Halomonas sp.]
MSNTFPPAEGARRNHYLLMRHGHSQANQEGRIISSPALGLTGFGLSPQGCAQLDTLLADWRWATPRRILHSDFLRTVETAERVAAHFGLPLTAESRLRERHFGELEGQSDARYAEVWARDALDPARRQGGVETVAQVAARMREVIDELEARHRSETILLVSHGDPLQILLTALEGRPLSLHREREALAPASITVL